MKISDSVLLNVFMRDNEKSATSLTPPSIGLTGIQCSTLKCIGVIDPEGPEKNI